MQDPLLPTGVTDEDTDGEEDEIEEDDFTGASTDER